MVHHLSSNEPYFETATFLFRLAPSRTAQQNGHSFLPVNEVGLPYYLDGQATVSKEPLAPLNMMTSLPQGANSGQVELHDTVERQMAPRKRCSDILVTGC